MKTTIDIPDALAQRAKEVARREGATLRELVVAGLLSEIERRSASSRIDFQFPTTGGQGLIAGLTPEEALDRSYGLPS
ncbi:hypothetical protein [Pseudactinotalea sp. Z1748]|uniref:hypothetical protein n=1 Tax=Pseudactinotalea sp. Z1748 TaxID=3413027 RepID=UPI003C7B488F